MKDLGSQSGCNRPRLKPIQSLLCLSRIAALHDVCHHHGSLWASGRFTMLLSRSTVGVCGLVLSLSRTHSYLCHRSCQEYSTMKMCQSKSCIFDSRLESVGLWIASCRTIHSTSMRMFWSLRVTKESHRDVFVSAIHCLIPSGFPILCANTLSQEEVRLSRNHLDGYSMLGKSLCRLDGKLTMFRTHVVLRFSHRPRRLSKDGQADGLNNSAIVGLAKVPPGILEDSNSQTQQSETIT